MRGRGRSPHPHLSLHGRGVRDVGARALPTPPPLASRQGLRGSRQELRAFENAESVSQSQLIIRASDIWTVTPVDIFSGDPIKTKRDETRRTKFFGFQIEVSSGAWVRIPQRTYIRHGGSFLASKSKSLRGRGFESHSGHISDMGGIFWGYASPSGGAGGARGAPGRRPRRAANRGPPGLCSQGPPQISLAPILWISTSPTRGRHALIIVKLPLEACKLRRLLTAQKVLAKSY